MELIAIGNQLCGCSLGMSARLKCLPGGLQRRSSAFGRTLAGGGLAVPLFSATAERKLRMFAAL